jgi:hypothetical protein
LFFSDTVTSSSTPARCAARKHSTVSASMPLIITERIILIAAAAPTVSPAIVTSMSSSARSGEAAWACSPAISIGVRWRLGWIGAITATSI